MSELSGTCIVCFKNVEIYSIGICDHPVCYECSTRMRVLCGHKECPICRRELSVVIFTRNIRPFKEINYNDFNVDDSAGISFEDPYVMNAFYSLQKIKCPRCPALNQPYFQTFKNLETHVKDEHNLMYCELCVTYLKLFPFERRPYTKSELSQHNKLGDKNDKSHKGHSLCKFCNKRFFDNDFLYRHLRQEHFSCHFCENDGHNKFYSSYEYLRHHFLKKHFLCEEGDCRGEQFTNVFRNEIDLKAHKLEKHGKSLSKQAYKEARILPLDIQRSTGNARNQLISHSSRSDIGSSNVGVSNGPTQEREAAAIINIAEFPTLSGLSGAAAPPVVSRRVTDRTHDRSNLRMTRENFPALGTEACCRPPPASSAPERPKSSVAAVSGTNRASANNLPSSSNKNSRAESAPVPQWGTTRKKENVQPPPEKFKQPRKERADDFPSLMPTTSSVGLSNSKPKKPKQGFNENDLPQSSRSSQINKIKVKKKQNFENNEEKSKPENVTKHQKSSETKQSSETNISTKPCKETKLSKNSNQTVNDSCSSSSNSKINIINAKTNSNGAQDKSKKVNSGSKKDKVIINESDFPSLTSNHSSNFNNNHNSRNNQNSSNNQKNSNQNNCNNLTHSNNQNNSSTKKSCSNNKSKKEKNILREHDFPALSNIQHSNNNQPAVKFENKSPNNASNSKKKKSVPPGFESQIQTAASNPPPGFTSLNHNVENNLLNQNFSYQNPANSRERHDALRQACRSIFRNKENLYDTFVQESHLFKNNILNAESYVKSVSNMMPADQFHSLFPELVFLLPNIQKQQELFAAYKKFYSKFANKLEKYDCTFCQQILCPSDRETHLNAHMLCLNFPSLGDSRKQLLPRK